MTCLPLIDLEPQQEHFQEDVLRGLLREQKSLPSKYLYDARGSALFDDICELDEYYLTRTELSIMNQHMDRIVSCLGPRCLIVEYGSGSGLKTYHLLERLHDPAGYVPVDISKGHLLESTKSLAARFPQLRILPVCADFTNGFKVPVFALDVARTVVYFPGSTIGNFQPAFAAELLTNIVAQCGAGGALLIGVDLAKDRKTLEKAYNDRRGVTGQFNLNLPVRINRELGADFRIDQFSHEGRFNDQHSRMEMHLVSLKKQTVSLNEERIGFELGETICTEHSYKYQLDAFHALAMKCGLEPEQVWTDDQKRFALILLRVPST